MHEIEIEFKCQKYQNPAIDKIAYEFLSRINNMRLEENNNGTENVASADSGKDN